MISVRHWVKCALAVTGLALASSVSAAVTYSAINLGGTTTALDVPSTPSSPTNGYTYVGGAATSSSTLGAIANASFVVPDFYNTTTKTDFNITNALLTIYLADDNDSSFEFAGFAVRKASDPANTYSILSNDATIDSTGPLKWIVHNAQSTGDTGTSSNVYEVDGRMCTEGTRTAATEACRLNYYDAYTFDVTSLLKEKEAFDLYVYRASNGAVSDANNDFWYKGAYLSMTTSVVKVPEPATLGLLGLGLIGIGLSRLRKIA